MCVTQNSEESRVIQWLLLLRSENIEHEKEIQL